MLEPIILISLICVTVMYCLKKWKLIQFYEMHVGKICYFCLGFWLAMIGIGIYMCFVQVDISIIVVPFACASLIAVLHRIIV